MQNIFLMKSESLQITVSVFILEKFKNFVLKSRIRLISATIMQIVLVKIWLNIPLFGFLN